MNMMDNMDIREKKEQIPELIIPIGLPMSGKTRWAKRHPEYTLHLIDQMETGKSIEKLRKDLLDGKSCISEALNLSENQRKKIFTGIAGVPCKKRALLFPRHPDLLKKRAKEHHKEVPDDAWIRFIKKFNMPAAYEGFDTIEIVWGENTTPVFTDEIDDFQQNNYHHSLTLGRHLKSAGMFAERSNFSSALVRAAYYHDVGKLWTKTWINYMGEVDGHAHFYGHAACGAYMYLIDINNRRNSGEEIDLPWECYVTWLISNHMRPYDWDYYGGIRIKDHTRWSGKEFEDICCLHNADLQAH